MHDSTDQGRTREREKKKSQEVLTASSDDRHNRGDVREEGGRRLEEIKSLKEEATIVTPELQRVLTHSVVVM